MPRGARKNPPRGVKQPTSEAVLGAVLDELVGMYRGNMYFEGLSGCAASLYNPADASMEASDGLNPVSSQGYVEVQAVEAWAIAKAGQTKDNPDDFDKF